MTQSFAMAARELLEQLKNRQQYRTLRPLPDQSSFIDLSNNDYLGLRSDSSFQLEARHSIKNLPVGAGASRLLGGESSAFEAMEADFAKWKRTESALYLSSGYLANYAVIGALASLGAEFFSDEFNHASIIDGMLTARCQKQVYPHSDLDALEDSLRKSTSKLKVIYSESLFSMDGDRASLIDLSMLALDHKALLVIDDAHAVGCFGGQGAGLSPDESVSINTCGKAMGVGGAVVCGPTWLRNLMINKSRAFIYSTGASPWMAAAVRSSVQYVKKLESRRAHLAEVSTKLRHQLQSIGLNIGSSASHIIPVIIGKEAETLRCSEKLLAEGVLAPAIRPPTVAENTCRLRLSLRADLTAENMHSIFECFKKL